MSNKSTHSSRSPKYVQKLPTTYKIVVLGRGAVGKSATTFQFIQLQFLDDYDPTIEDSFNKQCVIDNIPASLDILDTSGQDEFASLREEYIRRGEGFLIIFSVADRFSFEEVYKYRTSILRVKDRNDFPMVITGNKVDLEHERVVEESEARDMVKSFGSELCDYIETSAKTRFNIDKAFQVLVKLIRQYKESDSSRNQSISDQNHCCTIH